MRRLALVIHRRSLWQALAIYLGASLAVLEGVDVLIDRVGLPTGLFRVALVLLVVGLPIILMTAYVQGEGDEDAQAIDPNRAPGRREQAAPAQPPARLLTWRNAVGGGVLAFAAWGVIAATGAMTGFLDRRGGATVEPDPRSPEIAESVLATTSVAVLYFDDLSQAQDLGFLARGLTESLIHELAQVSALTVISRNGVKPFVNPQISIDSIARLLGAGSLVEGSVERFGEDGLSVTVQLIDGINGAHLMSRRLDREGTDFLALRDEVVQEVILALRSRLGVVVSRKKSRSATTSAEAWELVQRARQRRADAEQLWAGGDTLRTLAALEEAERQLARAEALDPEWPEPAVLRGSVASSMGIRRGPEYGAYADSAGELAVEYANRVLARWPQNADALALRGAIRARMWEHARGGAALDTLRDAAAADLERAVELDPDLAGAWATLTRLRRQTGDFAAAKLAAERAYEADAFLEDAALVLFNLCHISIELKEFEEAGRWCVEGERRFPGDGFFIEPQLVLLASDIDMEPDVGRAEALLQALLDYMAPSESEALEPVYAMYRAAVLARTGRMDSARAVIRMARAHPRAGDNASIDYYEANARLRLGERDAAVRRLETYLQASPGSRAYLSRDWWWEELHDHPRFRTLVGLDGS